MCFILPPLLATVLWHLQGRRTIPRGRYIRGASRMRLLRADTWPIMALLAEYDPRGFFAAERTLLAWVRTALALMGLGFVTARFEVLEPGRSSAIAGAALISVSIVFLLASAWIYVTAVRRLSRHEPFEGRPSLLALALTGTLVVLGAGAVAYLVLSG